MSARRRADKNHKPSRRDEPPPRAATTATSLTNLHQRSLIDQPPHTMTTTDKTAAAIDRPPRRLRLAGLLPSTMNKLHQQPNTVIYDGSGGTPFHVHTLLTAFGGDEIGFIEEQLMQQQKKMPAPQTTRF
jgi:hypothetical protein